MMVIDMSVAVNSVMYLAPHPDGFSIGLELVYKPSLLFIFSIGKG
jgi:hypothetical protein